MEATNTLDGTELRAVELSADGSRGIESSACCGGPREIVNVRTRCFVLAVARCGNNSLKNEEEMEWKEGRAIKSTDCAIE